MSLTVDGRFRITILKNNSVIHLKRTAQQTKEPPHVVCVGIQTIQTKTHHLNNIAILTSDDPQHLGSDTTTTTIAIKQPIKSN